MFSLVADVICFPIYQVGRKVSPLQGPFGKHLVHQTRLSHFFDISFVPANTPTPQRTSVLDKNQESQDLSQPRKGREDESVLEPHVRDPRGNATKKNKLTGCQRY